MTDTHQNASTFEYVILELYLFCFSSLVLFLLRYRFPTSTYLHAYIPYGVACVLGAVYFHFSRRRRDLLADATIIILGYFVAVPAMTAVELGGFGQGDFVATARDLVMLGAYVVPVTVAIAMIAGFLAGRLGAALQPDD